MLDIGHVTERRSRYADKPGLFNGRRNWIGLHLKTAGDLDRVGGCWPSRGRPTA